MKRKPISGPGGPARPASARTSPRFMLYSHDGFGLGHFRRNLVIAQALSERAPGSSILMACAAEGLETFTLPAGVDVLRLPGLRKVENGLYVGRRLNLETAELETLRASLLTSAVRHFRPHVLLVDKHPLGLGGELLPALTLQQRQAGHSALGLRDVLDDRRSTAAEWRSGELGRQVAALYQRVLVYGSPQLLDPLAEALLPPEAWDTVRFCGYVVGSGVDAVAADMPPRDGRPLVLATAGGGEDGRPLLETFIDATQHGDWQGVMVAGPQTDESQWAYLLGRAERAGVTALRSVQQVARWYGHADAVVCMGGYNSLLEAVTSGTPTVCVPRVRPRREQLIRAEAFAARGLLWLADPDRLTGPRLGAAIGDALRADRKSLAQRTRACLDLEGAARAAEILLALAAEAGRGAQAGAAAGGWAVDDRLPTVRSPMRSGVAE